MNTQLKPLLIVLVILIVFLAVREAIPKIRQPKSVYTTTLREIPKETVTTIVLSEAKETITLKKDESGWKTGEKKADVSKIDALLLALFPDDIPEIVSTSKDRYGEYGLTLDTIFTITLNDKVKLYIGKSGAFGTYVSIDGTDAVFILKSLTTSSLLPTINNWADKRVVAIERTKIKKLTLVKEGSNFSIVKKDDIWVQEGTDTEIAKDKMESAFLTIASFVATSLATSEDQKDYPKLSEFTLTIEEDSNQTLEFFKGESDYLVRRTSDGELFKVSSSMVDSVSKLVE